MPNNQQPIAQLIAAIQQEATREPFPVDTEVYQAAGADPLAPILFAGNLDSELCFFARDLGRDEVKARQPLFGAAGRLVRSGVHAAFFGKETPPCDNFAQALTKVFLTNTVPYKPPGNKAYPTQVKERFRPFLERLLVCHWHGSRIMPLGSEALEWFTPYDPGIAAFCKDPDRFGKQLAITLHATDLVGKQEKRAVTLLPLPHPSPLNQKYYALFPQMLQERLATIRC